MRVSRVSLLILVAALSARTPAAAAASAATRPANGGAPMVDKQLEGVVHAPEFPEGLDWLNTDRPLTLAGLRGKFVLLDFWTFCCINCMHVIPDLERLEEKYADSLVVIGVHSAKFENERGTDAIRQAILRYGVRHPVANDRDLKVWREYGVRAWPTLVLINPEGRIVGQVAGEGVYEPFDTVLSRGIPYFEAKGTLKRGPLKVSLEAAKSAPRLLSFPGKVSADEAGARLFISDSGHDRILVTTADGALLDVIGSGEPGQADGPFESARMRHPQGTAYRNGLLYIADTENHLIRVADFKARTLETLWGTGEQAPPGATGGVGQDVPLDSPWDLTFLGDRLYVAMAGAHQIWVADPKSLAIAPYAGSGREARVDGAADTCALAQPSGITTDGGRLYFADSESSSVRACDPSERGHVDTLVGVDLFEFGDVDGGRFKARLQHPLGVAWQGGLLYLADTYNSKIKVVDPKARTSVTLAGTGRHGDADGTLASATFSEPGGLCFLGGRLYVADANNHAIRVIDVKAGTVKTLTFSGLDRLARKEMETFDGRTEEVPPVRLKAGKSALVFSLDLPRGAHLNLDGPGMVKLGASGAVSLPDGVKSLPLQAGTFPLEVPLAAGGGRGEVVLDAVIFFCRNAGGGTCYVDEVRLKVPVDAGAAGASTAPVTLQVGTPP